MDDLDHYAGFGPEPSANLDKNYFTPLDTPIPAGLPEPALYRLFVMPVQIKKRTKSGLILPGMSVDAQLWLHAIGRVVALGPLCFKSPRYTSMGLTMDMTPKVGDLILYSSKTPTRFTYKGVNILVLNDDQFLARNPDPDTLDDYQFYV